MWPRAIEPLPARREKRAETITQQVEELRKATDDKLVTISNQISAIQAAIDDAIRSGKVDNLGILRVDLVALYAQRQRTEGEIGHIAGSSDAMASDVAAAGLDMK